MLITLDFETYYKTGKNRYSLKSSTTLDYVTDPQFEIIMCGIKVDDAPTVIFRGDSPELNTTLKKYFHPGNTNTLLCHNTLFDGLILDYHFGVHPAYYADTQSMFKAVACYVSSSLGTMAKALFPNDETKRKTKELVKFDGYRLNDLSQQQYEIFSRYCTNDVDLTYMCFYLMKAFFPIDELDVIDQTLRLYLEPVFKLNIALVKQTLTDLEEQKLHLFKLAKDQHGISKTTLSSNPQFAEWIKSKNIDIPTKVSPANGKLTYAFAKDDLEFIELQKNFPMYKTVWEARIAAKSTAEITRCQRFINNASKDNGWLRVPLKYHSAHTGRYGGGEKCNLQNLKRKSPLRRALCAEKGKLVYVADLSQIEARVNAWLSGETYLVKSFREGRDVYSEFASTIFQRPINRKRLATNDQGQWVNEQGSVVTDPDDAYKPDATEGFVGKVCILGLGYSMSANKFRDTLAKGAMGPPLHLSITEARNTVRTYRLTYPYIVNNWNTAQKHLIGMCQKDYTADWGPLRVRHQRIILPNNLCLNYPNLNYEQDEATGHLQMSYWNGRFDKNIYGGALVENVVQALAFVLIKEQLLTVIRQMPEMRYALQVHDENIFVGPADNAKERMAQLIELMSQPPTWAHDLPVAAEGGFAQNYSK